MDRESREYGFRMDTDKYAYLLRLNPREGEVYFCCYFREWLDRHMEHARRGIRFITPHYDDLFRLQDGDKIRITTWDDRTLERTCRYVDEYHLEVGTYPRQELYHICQFAELMERARNAVEPVSVKEMPEDRQQAGGHRALPAGVYWRDAESHAGEHPGLLFRRGRRTS